MLQVPRSHPQPDQDLPGEGQKAADQGDQGPQDHREVGAEGGRAAEEEGVPLRPRPHVDHAEDGAEELEAPGMPDGTVPQLQPDSRRGQEKEADVRGSIMIISPDYHISNVSTCIDQVCSYQ